MIFLFEQTIKKRKILSILPLSLMKDLFHFERMGLAPLKIGINSLRFWRRAELPSCEARILTDGYFC